MTNKEFKKFLEWIRNRLVYKYGETDPTVITALNILINNHYFVLNQLIKDKDLTPICKKYYQDFEFDKEEGDTTFAIGYSESEREKIKTFIQNIGKDLLEIYTS
jgi:hypothetical protein